MTKHINALLRSAAPTPNGILSIGIWQHENLKLRFALLFCLFGLPFTAGLTQAKPPTVDPTYGMPLPAVLPSAAQVPYWIWTAKAFDGQRICARTVLPLGKAPQAALVAVTADNFFTLTINGVQVSQTMPSAGSDAAWTHAHVTDVSKLLHAGRNVIAVECLNYGAVGGLVLQLDVDGSPALVTNDSWWVLDSPVAPAGWKTDPSFDTSDWQRPTDIAPLGDGVWGTNIDQWPGGLQDSLLSHTLLLPQAVSVLAGSVIHVSSLTSSHPDDVIVTPSTSDASPTTILVDFGKELSGQVQVVGTQGARIAVTTGESREECFRTTLVDSAEPYILNLSGDVPASTNETAFRYAKLVFTGSKPVQLSRVVCNFTYYPVRYKGSFECSDPVLTRIWYTGAYTAHLCMRNDVYGNPCARNDRSIWIGDLQVSGEVINNVFLDKFLMEKTIVGARTQVQNGQPNTEPPATDMNGIPAYDASWFCVLADFYRHTGDLVFLRSQHASILSLLAFQQTEFDSRNMFFNPPNRWDFSDWSPGFAGNAGDTLPIAATDLFDIKGVREAVFLLGQLGDKANADKYAAWANLLTGAARRNLIDSQTQTYGNRIQTNAMAVYSGVATASQQKSIYDRILKEGSPTWDSNLASDSVDSETISPYYGNFVLLALSKSGHVEDGEALLRRYWGSMLRRGYDTWWEKWDPKFPTDMNKVLDSDALISLCHGWSSGPTSFLTECVLGVQPTSGGFKTVDIVPDLGGLQWANGAVPTPNGIISIGIRQDGPITIVKLTVPSGVRARIGLAGQIFVKDKTYPVTDRQDNRNYIMLPHGGTWIIKSVAAAPKR